VRGIPFSLLGSATPRRRGRKALRSPREMVPRVRKIVEGAQLSAPFGRSDMAVKVAEATGER